MLMGKLTGSTVVQDPEAHLICRRESDSASLSGEFLLHRKQLKQGFGNLLHEAVCYVKQFYIERGLPYFTQLLATSQALE